MLVVTGTGTGVGKTVVTAAIAALARDSGQRVAVLKPVQTGVAPDELPALLELYPDVRGLMTMPPFTDAADSRTRSTISPRGAVSRIS